TSRARPEGQRPFVSRHLVSNAARSLTYAQPAAPFCLKAPCSLWRVFAVGAIASALLWLSEMIRCRKGQVSFAPVSVESVLFAGCPYNGLRMNRNQGVPVYGPEPF
ncbi:hypothetical protein, partial [Collinsella aerofaciens]|uniref:hypothetical protein n=1 Tax=Collinsella aerofaciens TaxID=74426 RepID=UPI0034A49CCD